MLADVALNIAELIFWPVIFAIGVCIIVPEEGRYSPSENDEHLL